MHSKKGLCIEKPKQSTPIIWDRERVEKFISD